MSHLDIVEDEVVGEELVHLFAGAIIVEVVAVKVAHVLDILQHHHRLIWVLRIAEQLVVLRGTNLIRFRVHYYYCMLK